MLLVVSELGTYNLHCKFAALPKPLTPFARFLLATHITSLFFLNLYIPSLGMHSSSESRLENNLPSETLY